MNQEAEKVQGRGAIDRTETSAKQLMERELFGVIAEFRSPEALVAATQRAAEAGYTRMDAYTPFPVHGLSEALGLKRNWLPYIVLLGAVLGGTGGYFLQYWTAAVDYVINVGGRPPHSWPAFMVITFETTILGAAVFGVFGMLALNRLPMPFHPVFNTPHFELASRDRFYLCILGTDPQFDEVKARTFLEGSDAQMVFDVEQSATRIYH